MRKQKKNGIPLKEVIGNHIRNNKKEYLIVLILFFVGLLLGILFINNTSAEQQTQVCDYITNFVTTLKEEKTIDQGVVFQKSMANNIFLTLLLWFMGSTVIGIFIVYGIIIFRGFCLGYTISALIATLGTGKGILFAICSILLQNILFIPCVLALAVSGIKLYQSIMKDKRKENIKVEIVRHTIFSIIICLILLISSLLEVYVSTNLIHFGLKFI